MRNSRSVRRWLGLPGRVAVLLGLGAISAAGAEARSGMVPPDPDPARIPQQGVADLGELRIWSEGGRLYLREAGAETTELLLGDTAEARHLRRLVESRPATAADPHVLRHRIILVGGGGESGPGSTSDQPSAVSQAPASTGGGRGAKAAPASSRPPESTGKPGPTPPTTGQKG